MAKGLGWRRLRQAVLFYVLLMVALGTWLSRERTTDWKETLWVAVYPINGDQTEVAENYIATLEADDFKSIQNFFKQQISAFGRTHEKPVHIMLMSKIDELPPALPSQTSALKVMGWSLKMRYWAYRMERSQESITPDIKIFMVYFDPAINEKLSHSVGLQKGLFGIVNGYASRKMRGRNHVVFAHELLHTLGATDKYDPATALPMHPDGYADPNAAPLFPQSAAEIMGGRIPLSPTSAVMPNSLRRVIVGPTTAREIRWLND